MYLQFVAGNKCEVTVVALNKFLTEDCPNGIDRKSIGHSSPFVKAVWLQCAEDYLY